MIKCFIQMCIHHLNINSVQSVLFKINDTLASTLLHGPQKKYCLNMLRAHERDLA